MVSQYSHFIGGVDRIDKNVDNYRMGVRSKKWWWPIIAFVVDVNLYTTLQLYWKAVNNMRIRINKPNFRSKYGTALGLRSHPAATKPLEKRVLPGIRVDSKNQFLQSAIKQSSCAMCKKNSRKMCKKCKVNLHVICFEGFHKLGHQ